MSDADVWRGYKPIRNRVRKYSADSLLHACSDALLEIEEARDKFEVMKKYQPWNVLLLARFALAEGAFPGGKLVDKGVLHDLLNRIHDLEPEIFDPRDYEWVELFFKTLGHQQLWMQKGPTLSGLVRQYIILGHLPENHGFNRCFRLRHKGSVEDYFRFSLALTSFLVTTDERLFGSSIFSQLSGYLSVNSAGYYLDYLSVDPLENRGENKLGSLKINRDLFVSPTSFSNYPLVKVKARYYVLYKNLLHWRLENFVYDEIRGAYGEGFGTKFGYLFQEYCESILCEASLSFSKPDDDASNSKMGQLAPDYLVSIGNAKVVVEVKGTELSRMGVMAMDPESLYRAVKSSLAKALLQVADYVAKWSPEWTRSDLYVLVVTWRPIEIDVNALVQAVIECRGGLIWPTCLRKENIHILSIEEFEYLAAYAVNDNQRFIECIRIASNRNSDRKTYCMHFAQHMAAMGCEFGHLPSHDRAVESLVASLPK